MTVTDQSDETVAEAHFAFGDNWASFLSTLDDERIAEAERSLLLPLGLESLEGMRVLDAGCGSGLFSLAAIRLGAAEVHSFDFDPASAGCALKLRRGHAPDAAWTIEQGDLLDGDYLATLGTFDLVYSWGVLHHTGAMDDALANVARLVAPDGRLFIAIYNDQGHRSDRWRAIKRTYGRVPAWARPAYTAGVMSPLELRSLLGHTARGRPGAYVRNWTRYKEQRGMSRWHDLVDWVGGYPFEVATPEAIFGFYRDRGFALTHLRTCGGGLGCNEFVFTRDG